MMGCQRCLGYASRRAEPIVDSRGVSNQRGCLTLGKNGTVARNNLRIVLLGREGFAVPSFPCLVNANGYRICYSS